MSYDKPLCCQCKNSEDSVRRGHALCLAFYLREEDWWINDVNFDAS